MRYALYKSVIASTHANVHQIPILGGTPLKAIYISNATTFVDKDSLKAA
jgi:hypothetical protein